VKKCETDDCNGKHKFTVVLRIGDTTSERIGSLCGPCTGAALQNGRVAFVPKRIIRI
jgi:hypothetical protein